MPGAIAPSSFGPPLSRSRIPVANAACSAVLLTGASGFLAVHVALQLLKRGYKVRGTVRSAAKGKYLDNLFAKFGDKWEWVIVEDVETVRSPIDREESDQELTKGLLCRTELSTRP